MVQLETRAAGSAMRSSGAVALRLPGRALGAATRAGTDLPLLSPLRFRDFRLLWSGNLVSLIGDNFQTVALAILALDLTHSTAILGTVLMVQAIPRLFLTLLGGVAVDRFQARSVLLVTNVLQAGLVAALCALSAANRLETWHLYAYAVPSGMVLAFYLTAANTIIPEVLPPEEVHRGNALSNVAFNLVRTITPPLAGVVIALAGSALAFGINAASFVVAALAIWLMRPRPRDPLAQARAGAVGQIVEGIRAAAADEVIWITLLIFTVAALGYFGATLVAIPALAKFALGAGDAGVGLLYGAVGTGALVGAVATGLVSRVPRPGATGCATIVANGAALALAAVAPTMALAMAALALSGFLTTAGAIIFFSLVQTRSTPALRGRIMALITLALASTQPLSYAVAGIGGDTLGPRAIILLGGACVAAAGVFGLARTAMRAAQ